VFFDLTFFPPSQASGCKYRILLHPHGTKRRQAKKSHVFSVNIPIMDSVATKQTENILLSHYGHQHKSYGKKSF